MVGQAVSQFATDTVGSPSKMAGSPWDFWTGAAPKDTYTNTHSHMSMVAHMHTHMGVFLEGTEYQAHPHMYILMSLCLYVYVENRE